MASVARILPEWLMDQAPTYDPWQQEVHYVRGRYALQLELLDTRDDKGNPDVTQYGGREVVSVDGPLVKFRDGDRGETIVNTNSPLFVRATLWKETPERLRPMAPPKKG